MRLFYVGRLMSDTAMNESNTHENPEQHEEVDQPVLAPGAQLAARRQALNWSIEHVANQLNLAPRQIQAIEADNYAALPGMASVRGFIRSYAKLLKIDPAPLLLVIAAEMTGSDELMPLRRALSSIPFSESRLSSASRHGLSSKPAVIALFLVLLVAAIVVGQKMKWFSILPESLSLKIDKELPLLSASVQNTPVLAVPDSVALDKVNYAGSTSYPAATNAVATAGRPDISGSNGNAAGQADVNEMTPAAQFVIDTKDMLVLKLREDSWIEIKRPDNSMPISRLVKAGETETYRITAPVSLTIGNASGVDATLRGAPIALQADAKNNVARLNLK
jgi:cytoskeleton protein RodZ